MLRRRKDGHRDQGPSLSTCRNILRNERADGPTPDEGLTMGLVPLRPHCPSAPITSKGSKMILPLYCLFSCSCACLCPKGRRGSGGAGALTSTIGLIRVAVLAACGNEGRQLSIEEGLKCANEAYKTHAGTINRRGNVVAYSYESANGAANVVVTFDRRRRPVSTFFESAPWAAIKSSWTLLRR